jgi:hypothetical protein
MPISPSQLTADTSFWKCILTKGLARTASIVLLCAALPIAASGETHKLLLACRTDGTFTVYRADGSVEKRVQLSLDQTFVLDLQTHAIRAATDSADDPKSWLPLEVSDEAFKWGRKYAGVTGGDYYTIDRVTGKISRTWIVVLSNGLSTSEYSGGNCSVQTGTKF